MKEMNKIHISIEAVKRIIEKARRGQKLSPDEWAFVNFVRHSFGAYGFKKACQMLKEAGL